MKPGKIIAGSLAAGLAAAFLGGAVWSHDADVDWSRYPIDGDVVTVVGAVLGALFLVLGARLLYLGVHPKRDRNGGAEGPPSRPPRSTPA